MRGTRPHRPRWHSGQGIIPACAGNTWTEGLRPGDAGDHPRVCGEHLDGGFAPRRCGGSSPRVRGTQMPPGPPKPQPRIIPACAGNTEAAVDDEIVSRDHPRVCGEHAEHDPIVSAVRGSSPRVRGTRQARQKPDRPAGIIPACAGNTDSDDVRIAHDGDHPRVCGEHVTYAVEGASSQGSSPRVRGTQGRSVVRLPTAGIIPACAGNT